MTVNRDEGPSFIVARVRWYPLPIQEDFDRTAGEADLDLFADVGVRDAVIDALRDDMRVSVLPYSAGSGREAVDTLIYPSPNFSQAFSHPQFEFQLLQIGNAKVLHSTRLVGSNPNFRITVGCLQVSAISAA